MKETYRLPHSRSTKNWLSAPHGLVIQRLTNPDRRGTIQADSPHAEPAWGW
jgi:hypothetical protein